MRRDGTPGSREEVRLQQATLLSVAGGFHRAGCAGPAKPQARAEDPLSTHGGSRPPGDSASLPRHGSHAGGDRPEALPERLGNQHSQCPAGHRRVRPSKKNSISIDRSLIGRSRPSGPRNAPAPSPAIRSVSSAACGNSWPTRSPAT